MNLCAGNMKQICTCECGCPRVMHSHHLFFALVKHYLLHLYIKYLYIF